MSAPRPKRLSALVRELERAADKQVRASRARAALPPGSSRARVTSANAKHGRACEAVTVARKTLMDALVASVGVHLERTAADAACLVCDEVVYQAERAAAEKEHKS